MPLDIFNVGFVGIISVSPIPWSIVGLTLIQSKSISTEEQAPQDLFFKPDGTKMYLLGDDSDDITEFSLSTAWDISTLSATATFSVGNEISNVSGLWFKPDGTKMWAFGYASDRVFAYSLSTAWDITTSSYDSVSFLVRAQDHYGAELTFSTDGSQFFITSDKINEYAMTTSWDISTASHTRTSVTLPLGNALGNYWKPDGSKLIVTGSADDEINSYTFSTNYDVSTLSAGNTVDISAIDNDPSGIFVKPDGLTLWICGKQNDKIYEFSMG